MCVVAVGVLALFFLFRNKLLYIRCSGIGLVTFHTCQKDWTRQNETEQICNYLFSVSSSLDQSLRCFIQYFWLLLVAGCHFNNKYHFAQRYSAILLIVLIVLIEFEIMTTLNQVINSNLFEIRSFSKISQQFQLARAVCNVSRWAEESCVVFFSKLQHSYPKTCSNRKKEKYIHKSTNSVLFDDLNSV